jgi:hypothetical protein
MCVIMGSEKALIRKICVCVITEASTPPLLVSCDLHCTAVIYALYFMILGLPLMM